MPLQRSGPRSENEHRHDREAGAIVYPVVARRSFGLSVGVNLFPDRKRCNFDCPYCEVFPFKTELRFSLDALERGLRMVLTDAVRSGLEIKDICFSGNGEPTLSPHLKDAVELAARFRADFAPAASLVVITNGSTLSDPAVAGFLSRAVASRSAGGLDLDLWVKLDAGTEAWYAAIDRGTPSFAALVAGIESFAAASPITVQTMLCAIKGAPPPPEEEAAWTSLAVRLARTGNVRRFQLYGKARPASEDPLTEALPASYLESRAVVLRSALASEGDHLPQVPVQVFP